ncbi:MAG: MaoC family dehydratase [Caulobacter sp.]|nr:MaoC family dehydratase [Caulobacter sp.]
MQGLFLEDLTVGQSAEMTRTADERTIQLFAEVSGDNNPLHLDEDYAQTTQFKGRIAHGMLSAAYISAVIGTQLPGPGSVYMGQSLSFRRPVRVGDEVHTVCTIKDIDAEKGRVTIDTVCSVNGKAVLTGEALIMAPKRG